MKAAVLLSGGVDSSVALAVLKQSGDFELTAFYLKIWLEDELAYLGDCPWETDLRYAREVCEMLDIPLEIVPLQSEYHARVVEHAIAELRAGRTPSPDILCNQRIKFGEFFSRIDGSFQKVASGHYAQIGRSTTGYQLKRSPDPVKDQTYFLSHLNQDQLSRALFPVGHMTKREVREVATELKLPTMARKDSQGICFLGKIAYPEFVRHHLGECKGAIIELETQRTLGEHDGYWFYTIGQRQGLGLGNGPWFVVGKDVQKNTVFVSHKDNFAAQARDTFTVADLHWIGPPPERQELAVKIRHAPEIEPCTLTAGGDGGFTVKMQQPDTGIAAGQYAVFYDGDLCLGSGVIT